MATVVTPHPFNQSAMAWRSQELAPNRRTCAGKAPGSPSTGGPTHSAGTQTMCMSEWTSMPAAWGLRMVRAGGCARGGRDGLGAGLPGAAERLRWLMVSLTLGGWGEHSRREPRGEREICSFPNGINASAAADVRHQWQGRRL